MGAQTVNHAEIEAIIGFIEAFPEGWDQGCYARRYADDASDACGTAYCVAGWACVRAGYKIYWHKDQSESALVEDGSVIHNVARDLLGLTMEQADRLFEATNTIDNLKTIAKSFHEAS